MRGERVAAAAAAASWALGAWCASGVIAPEIAGPSSRVGALAPMWLLGLLLAGAVTVAAFTRLTARVAAPLWLPLIALLPWLPVPLPPAALLAVGPPGQLLAAACVLASAIAARRERPAGFRLDCTRAAVPILLLVCVFCASAWWISPRIPGGDEPHYLIITQSLLADADLRIEDNHRRREYAAYVDGELRPDYLRRGRDGAIYSIHAPGVSVLVLPAFLLAGYRGAVLTVAVLSALGLVIVWRAAHEVSGSVSGALVATAGVGLSVPFFFQTFTIYPDGPAAVMVAVVIWLGLTRSGPLSWQRALACGSLLFVLPWLHTRYGAIAGPLGLVVAGRLLWPRQSAPWSVRLRGLTALAVPALVSGVAWLWMFQAIYGTWDPRAPYGHATDMRWARIPHGLTGLLLDQQFGLLPNAPIYLMALAGLGALWRRDRRLTAELLALTLPYLTAVAAFHMWWGGRSSPSRFLVPVLLPLALPLAAWWARATSRTARAVTLLLLGASLGLAAAFVMVDHGALLYNSRDGHALWLLAADPSVNLTYALPSFFQGTPAAAWRTAGAWLLAGTLGWLVLRRVESRRPAPGPWLAGVLGVAAVVLACGASLGWALSPGTSWDAGSGMVAVAARACRADAIGVRTSPARVVRAGGVATGVPIGDASRRAPPDAAPRWMAGDMPPGRYRLVVTSGLNVSGTVTIALGRPDRTLMSCTLVEQAPGPAACVMDLPAGASALWITGDAALARTAEQLAVISIEPADPESCGLRAQRAVAGASGTLFVLSGRVWAEGAGLWTAGGEEVAMVADPSASTVSLRIRQGGAAGMVSLRSGAWNDGRRLGAGEIWEVDVPRRSTKAVAFTVATTAGFRPSDLDPSSSDSRVLGAWVEPR